MRQARLLRYQKDGAPIDAPPIKEEGFHLFLSHVWGTGQDQMRIIKQRLLEMILDIKVFLDVDDLIDISDLEGYISRSQHVLIFCSKGYFQSRNCMREVRRPTSFDQTFCIADFIDERCPAVPSDRRSVRQLSKTSR